MTKNSPNNDVFSSSEVGLLVEDLRSDFRCVSEGLGIVRDDVCDLKDRVNFMNTHVRYDYVAYCVQLT